MAKWLIIFGLILVAAGVAVFLLDRLGLFKLPGDLTFTGRNWRIFLPVTSCIVISIVLTVSFWLIRFFRR